MFMTIDNRTTECSDYQTYIPIVNTIIHDHIGLINNFLWFLSFGAGNSSYSLNAP
jgi:hypothetical protein